MYLSSWLSSTTHKLSEAGIATARLDALVLLEDALHIDRAQLLAHPEYELTAEQISTLDAQIKRRMTHEPLAYIRAKTEFYGREFSVNKNVLEPRPESETMIDLLKTLPVDEHATIVDIGTGSGALAITAKLELPQTRVIGIDIDPACLQVAKKNAVQLNARVQYIHGDLAQPLADASNNKPILLCNLPYVPDEFPINLAAGHEPRLAIFGGSDGLDLYRKLFMQLDNFVSKPTYILTEALPAHHQRLAKLAENHGYQLRASEDFIQIFA